MSKEFFDSLENLKVKKGEKTQSTCLAGHTFHEKIPVLIDLVGKHSVHDFPKIKKSIPFMFLAYNSELYDDFDNYCTGKDELSRAILSSGTWEGFETAVAIDIFLKGDRNHIVLDFGAQLGWYSIIAATNGYRVISFEADEENIQSIKSNAKLNGCAGLVYPIHCWINESSQKISSDVEDIELMKCDIEGLDEHAIRMCEDIFKKRKVRNLLMEISPSLKKGIYTKLVKKIIDYGYIAHNLPDKGFEHMEELENNPIECVKKYCALNIENIEEYVEGLGQANFLFIKR